MTLKELLEKRAKLIADARAVAAKAEAEKRDMTSEEAEQVRTMLDDAKKTKAEADVLEGRVRLAADLEDAERDLQESEGRRTQPANPAADAETRRNPAAQPNQPGRPFEQRWRNRHGQERSIEVGAGVRQAEAEYRSQFGDFLRRGVVGQRLLEGRAMAADTDVDGGFLVAPIQMVAELIKFLDDAVSIRGLARTFPVISAQSLGAPSYDTDIADAEWTSEIKDAPEETTGPKFGGRELNPTPVSKLIKVSNKLLRLAMMNPEGIVRDRLGYKFAVTEEKAFMTGTGANQPLGVFTASSIGISTGRDVSTGNTTTAFTADGLINCKGSLKGQYRNRPSTRWLFHRDAVTKLQLLKDGDGQYLWRQGLVGGEPDRLLNIPIVESEFAPNTFTTGKYVGILGDFSFYWIADALALQIQRLNELYARSNQTGFIGRKETDAMPVLEEAFARVKLA